MTTVVWLVPYFPRVLDSQNISAPQCFDFSSFGFTVCHRGGGQGGIEQMPTKGLVPSFFLGRDLCCYFSYPSMEVDFQQSSVIRQRPLPATPLAFFTTLIYATRRNWRCWRVSGFLVFTFRDSLQRDCWALACHKLIHLCVALGGQVLMTMVWVCSIRMLIMYLLLLLVLLILIPAKLLLMQKLHLLLLLQLQEPHIQPPPTFWRIHILISILILFPTRTSTPLPPTPPFFNATTNWTWLTHDRVPFSRMRLWSGKYEPDQQMAGPSTSPASQTYISVLNPPSTRLWPIGNQTYLNCRLLLGR